MFSQELWFMAPPFIYFCLRSMMLVNLEESVEKCSLMFARGELFRLVMNIRVGGKMEAGDGFFTSLK